MSAAGRALSKALDNPQDWTGDGEFRIKHIPSGLEFWIGNGGFFFDEQRRDKIDGERAIGLIERHWLYSKARKIIKANRRNPGAELIARLKASQA